MYKSYCRHRIRAILLKVHPGRLQIDASIRRPTQKKTRRPSALHVFRGRTAKHNHSSNTTTHKIMGKRDASRKKTKYDDASNSSAGTNDTAAKPTSHEIARRRRASHREAAAATAPRRVGRPSPKLAQQLLLLLPPGGLLRTTIHARVLHVDATTTGPRERARVPNHETKGCNKNGIAGYVCMHSSSCDNGKPEESGKTGGVLAVYKSQFCFLTRTQRQ